MGSMVRLLILACVSFLLKMETLDIGALATRNEMPSFMENRFIEDPSAAVRDADGNPDDSPAIVYGQEATNRTRYPWVAFLVCFPTMNFINGWSCGGSLISAQFVLTAAHCVSMNENLSAGANNNTGILPTRCVIQLGGLTATFQDESTESNYWNITETDIHRHQNYTSHATNIVMNDIALIRLKPAVTLSPYIQPIALPNQTTNYTNARVEIIGWGRTESGNSSLNLMVANTTMRDEATCSISWNSPGRAPSYIASAMNCYGGAGTEGVCRGDSGTGVITRQTGAPVLVSINSFVATAPVLFVAAGHSMSGELQDKTTNDEPSSRQQSMTPLDTWLGWRSALVRTNLWSFIARQKSSGNDTTTTATSRTTTSTTTRPPNQSGCLVSTPNVGVRVSEYLNWIRNTQNSMTAQAGFSAPARGV